MTAQTPRSKLHSAIAQIFLISFLTHVLATYSVTVCLGAILVPALSPHLVFTPLEIRLLDHLVKDKASPAQTLAHYLAKVARLGGYLARAKDPPPGTMVMWRGLSRLTDIELGASLGRRLVGN
jgi:hypothetical protein